MSYRDPVLLQATSGDIAVVYIVAIATVIGAAVAGLFLFRRR